MAAAALVQKVEEFLRRESIRPGRIVVAVSGGPDSVALLLALLSLRSAQTDASGLQGTEPMIIAHLNHQLRGTESDTDESFVKSLCEILEAKGVTGLQCRCDRLDVAAQAEAEGANLEAVARRLRYDWLTKIAQESGCAFVATGHTADDQAETVLHRLIRGTGLKGLRGIAPRRLLSPEIELIRPLLQVRREEVIAYLHQEKQSYRQDSSNLDRDFTRNRIRIDLLPYLAEHYNPGIVPVLSRLAAQASEAFAELESQARACLSQLELARAGRWVVFDAQSLASVSRPLLCEVFRLIWTREGWPLGSMGFTEWNRLAGAAAGADTALDLPDGIRLRRRERVVLIGPDS